MREVRLLEAANVSGSGVIAATLTAPIAAACVLGGAAAAGLVSPVVFYQSYRQDQSIVQGTINTLSHLTKGPLLGYAFMKDMYNW